jgi:hypothetical protein
VPTRFMHRAEKAASFDFGFHIRASRRLLLLGELSL